MFVFPIIDIDYTDPNLDICLPDIRIWGKCVTQLQDAVLRIIQPIIKRHQLRHRQPYQFFPIKVESFLLYPGASTAPETF